MNAARVWRWPTRQSASLIVVLALACAGSILPVRADAQVNATAILDHIRVTGQRAIDFHAVALPESVFVGQQATYQVAVMLSQDAKSRLRRNPEFLPPELRGLLAYELGTPVRVPWRNYGQNEYESHIFQRALFPVTAGTLVVPAPQLSYALPQSSSYFSREERFVVKAESASIVVRPLPDIDRPADFSGAVGVFRTTVRIDTSAARVGDPIVLTMRVLGTGNVKLLPRPVIELDWASVVAGTERVQVDSGGPLVKGFKEFDWILTPTREGRVIIPEFRYSYFDPYQRQYAASTTGGGELAVRAGALATLEEDDGTALPELRTTDAPHNVTWWFGRERPSPLGWLSLLLALFAPIPAVMVMVQNRSRTQSHQTLGGTTPFIVPLPMPEDAGPRGQARATRRRLLDALATRFEQGPHALVARRQVMRVLRRGGVSRTTTQTVMALLKRLDELGFANDTPDGSLPAAVDTSSKAVDEVLRQIEAEAMTRGRHIRWRRRLQFVVVFSLVYSGIAAAPCFAQRTPKQTVPARSAAPSTDSADMPSGRLLVQLAHDAYQRRAFTEAAQRFSALARAYPRDPDILANWGTSAWALGDTVHAVVAWQRASRIEPFTLDLQERVSQLPSGARGGIADIPMVPVSLLSALAIAGWLLGWIMLAWRWKLDSRWRARLRRISIIMILLSVVCAAGARWGMSALDTAQLAVVTRPETMRIAPGVDADAMGGVTTGDVVRVLEVRETWQHVVHADGRRGWLPRTRLIALDDSRLTR